MSSLYENSLTSLTSELGLQSLEGANTVSAEENVINSSRKDSASNFEGQPDLIYEVGISGSQQPDLVSSQEILRSCSPRAVLKAWILQVVHRSPRNLERRRKEQHTKTLKAE